MGKGWWLVLGVCAVLTHRQIPRFADDVALWRAAAAVSDAPRPSVNLAAQAIVRGDYLEARVWMARAQRQILPPIRQPERRAVLDILDRQQTWIDAFSPSR